MRNFILLVLMAATIGFLTACNFGEVNKADSNKEVAVANNKIELNKKEPSSIENKEVTINQNKIIPTNKNETEKRCGWYVNPTPANHYLFDKDGRWVIGEQGGYQLKDKDFDNIPDFGDEWVTTNAGSYGYGCVCFNVKVDKKERKILSIKSSEKLPLSKCREDKNLEEPN